MKKWTLLSALLWASVALGQQTPISMNEGVVVGTEELQILYLVMASIFILVVNVEYLRMFSVSTLSAYFLDTRVNHNLPEPLSDSPGIRFSVAFPRAILCRLSKEPHGLKWIPALYAELLDLSGCEPRAMTGVRAKANIVAAKMALLFFKHLPAPFAVFGYSFSGRWLANSKFPPMLSRATYGAVVRFIFTPRSVLPFTKGAFSEFSSTFIWSPLVRFSEFFPMALPGALGMVWACGGER